MDTMNTFTKDEQTILKNTSDKYKWIARDMNGPLFVYNKKPKKFNRFYSIIDDDGRCFRLEPFEDIFKGITWKGGPVQFRKDVLYEMERKYLKAVLRPFRNRDVRIIKLNAPICSRYYLRADFEDGGGLSLPNFSEGTMYNGMELYHEYTLEELGINY